MTPNTNPTARLGVVATAALMALMALGAQAQTAPAAPTAAAPTAVTIYGSLDQYFNVMHSSAGGHIVSLEDGALFRSRLGFKGSEALGGGPQLKWQIETGFSADSGGQADANRLYDRQAWVGVADARWGEFRMGRQNGPIQTHGGYVDYTARTLGSVINNFGVPSRYDNDLSYQSPRVSTALGTVSTEVHVALPEAPANDALVWQAALDWAQGDWRAGYVGLRGKPAKGATVDKDVVYDNLYANWLWGQGTVYLAFVRSNNSTATAVSNNAGAILGNTGGYNAGTSADLAHFYDLWQVSADWQLTPQLRLGALWGRIGDQSGRGRNANGASVGAYYDLSKRTTLLLLADTQRNSTEAGFRPGGSAGLKSNFATPANVNGQTINGLQAGVVHRF